MANTKQKKSPGSKATRTRHVPEFKQEALALAARVDVTASEPLGLQGSQLYEWRRKALMVQSRAQSSSTKPRR